jgi:hypothetical protein
VVHICFEERPGIQINLRGPLVINERGTKEEDDILLMELSVCVRHTPGECETHLLV